MLITVNGREREFSKEELTQIVNQYYNGTTQKQEKLIKMRRLDPRSTDKPAEEKYFQVIPQEIDQYLFKRKVEDPWIFDDSAETIRKLILKAFEEMKKNPTKYGRRFRTFIPKKETWDKLELKTAGELQEYTEYLGGHVVDWVKQALEWAQRIHNGEPWSNICKEDDTSSRYPRFIIWKDGYYRIVGGYSRREIQEDFSVYHSNDFYPASHVSDFRFGTNYHAGDMVPVIAFYEE